MGYAEVTASLLHRPRMNGLGSAISDAVSWIAQENPIAALRLNVRNRGSNSDTELLQLTYLAKISPEDLQSIFSGILKSIPSLAKRLHRFAGEHQYQTIAGEHDGYNPAETGNWLLRSALTHLRDLSPVLNEKQRQKSIKTIFELRRGWKNGQWQTWDQIEKTIQQLLVQCSEQTIEKLLPEIVEQPVVGFDTDGSSPATRHDVITQSCMRILSRTITFGYFGLAS